MQHFMNKVMAIDVLTHEQERQLLKLATAGDIAARDQLVSTHIKLVVKLAKQYSRSNTEDLTQEGILALIKCVDNFNIAVDVRFSTLAITYIKSAFNNYTVKNARIYNIATTKPLRKLFFNLRTLMREYNVDKLSSVQQAAIADKLSVPLKDVIDMEIRLANGDYSISHDDETIEFEDLADPVFVIETMQYETQCLTAADMLAVLSERERDIISSRYLSDTPVILETLSIKYSVSKERIRQIEVAALKKLKNNIPS